MIPNAFEPANIKRIASQLQTPFYLYAKDRILHNLNYVNSCFSWQQDYMNYFPVKDNPNPAVLKCLWEAGSGLLVCGKAELMLAKRCGFIGERLLYHPMRKDLDAERIAEELNVSWLVTSKELLPMYPASSILLRLYPDCDCFTSSELVRMKSGIPMKELVECLQILKVRNVPRIGIELQLKPFVLRPRMYLAKVQTYLSLLPELKRRSGASIEYCNLGDGLADINLSGTEAMTLENTAEQIRLVLNEYGEDCPIIQTCIGRQVLASSGILVSTITEIRQLEQPYLVLDASYGQFIRPALLSAEHEITVIQLKRKSVEPKIYRIIGLVSDDFNKLHTGKAILQASVGDLCIIHGVGCGARSMPMLHRFQAVCPEYMLQSSGSVELIGAGKSEEEVMEFLTSF